jgi:hypothetical protein
MKPIAMNSFANVVSKHEVLSYLREQGYVVLNRIGMYERFEWNSEKEIMLLNTTF